MRRLVYAAAAAAIVAAAAAVKIRRSRPAGRYVPGAMPGRIGSALNSYLNRPLYALMAAALNPAPDDVLLDVACGSGVFLAEYAVGAGRVAGIDLSEPKVELARRRLHDRIIGGTAEVVHGDARSLPWKDAVFSAVTSMDAWGFVLFPDPAPVLSEMHRVLRPGGRLVVQLGYNVPDEAQPQTLRAKLRGTFWTWTETEVRRFFEEAGFSQVSLSYGRTAGNMRLFGLVARLVGVDESRLVCAAKPLPVQAATEVPAGNTIDPVPA